MSDADGVLDRLVEALSLGDRDEALTCFAPGASVVVSGTHHDYASYPPKTIVDRLLHDFMEFGWTPEMRRVAGGAVIEEGVLAATQIGEFLGLEPKGERLRANVRVSYSLAADGRLATLSVWGSREAVLAQLGVPVGAAETADALMATARERLPSGVREFTTEEVAAFPLPPLPGETRPASPEAVVITPPAAPRPFSEPPSSPRSTRQMVVWSATALALVALVFGAVQLTLNVLPSADAVAGSLAGSVVPPSPQAVAVPTRPPIVAQSVHQSMATLGGSGTPITAASGPELLAGTNAGLASLGPSVQFDYDSAAIRSDAVARIDELAAAIATRNLTGVIFVHGYTDNLGSHEHGILLSTQRAENVARILQERLEGRPVQLVTAGYGEADPVGDNATPEGQSLNRRVLVLYRPSA